MEQLTFSSTALMSRPHLSHWSPRASGYAQWGQIPSTKRSARKRWQFSQRSCSTVSSRRKLFLCRRQKISWAILWKITEGKVNEKVKKQGFELKCFDTLLLNEDKVVFHFTDIIQQKMGRTNMQSNNLRLSRWNMWFKWLDIHTSVYCKIIIIPCCVTGQQLTENVPISNQNWSVSAHVTPNIPRSKSSRNNRLCIYYQERKYYTLLCLLLGCGSSKEVKVNLEPLVDGGVNDMVLVTDLLWRQTLLYGLVLCSRAVLVCPAHKQDIPAAQSTVPETVMHKIRLDYDQIKKNIHKARCRKSTFIIVKLFYRKETA